MKILQIHNVYQKHGGEDAVVEVERDLLESHGNCVLRLIAHNKNINNLLLERLLFFNKLNSIILENPDIDIVHVHNIFSIIGPNIYQYLHKNGLPIVQTVHNFRLMCPNGLFFDNNHQICELCKNGNFKNSILKKCYHESYLFSFLMQYQVKQARNFALKYVDKFISLSNFSKNKLIESGFDDKKIVVKSNFLYPQPPKESFKHDNYALYIGRLSKEKGLDVLINAFKDIKYNLIIAGTGDTLEQLKKENENFKNIKFLGFVSGAEKESIIENSSFLIIPSLQYENFPVSILEAFCRAKTVIASRIGSIPEIITDGYSGLLFEMGNSENLKKCIISVLDNNRFEELGRNAYFEFNKKYQTYTNYKQLIQIYESVIKK